MRDTERGGQVTPFTEVLGQIRRGAAADECAAALAEVVQAVELTGKKGRVVLELEIAPSKLDSSALQVTDKVKTTVPAPERPASLFFADEGGSLVRHDPRQSRLDGMED